MARSITRKCLECTQLNIEQVQQLHGTDGDSCWDPKRCHRRRSHYRNRKDINAKRRGQYALANLPASGEAMESISVPVQAPVVAFLYLYRKNRQDAPLHALSISVWCGDQKQAEVDPIHCMGMTNRQVNDYLREVLATLGDRFGIRKFEASVRLEPYECPIADCPLKHHGHSGA